MADAPDIATVRALFAEMREARVFVFRGYGLEVQMSANAWPPHAAELVQAASAVAPEPKDVALEDMPPELAGPYMAFRRKQAEAIGDLRPQSERIEAEEAQLRARYNPTDPEGPVDDAMQLGADLPEA